MTSSIVDSGTDFHGIVNYININAEKTSLSTRLAKTSKVNTRERSIEVVEKEFN